MWPFKRKVHAGSHLRVLSWLTPAEARSLDGIPGEAVIGVYSDDPPNPESVRTNRVFVDFMHQVIAAAGPKDPGLIAAARQQGNGWFYVIDLRTPEGPQGRVPPEDIIGAFEVRAGEVVPGSYQPSDSHRVFSESGLVQLPPFFREAFVAELQRRRG